MDHESPNLLGSNSHGLGRRQTARGRSGVSGDTAIDSAYVALAEKVMTRENDLADREAAVDRREAKFVELERF